MDILIYELLVSSVCLILDILRYELLVSSVCLILDSLRYELLVSSVCLFLDSLRYEILGRTLRFECWDILHNDTPKRTHPAGFVTLKNNSFYMFVYCPGVYYGVLTHI